MKKILGMLLVIFLVAGVITPIFAASGKGAVKAWLALLPNGKMIVQNRDGSLCYIYGSTWAKGVEISSHLVVLGDLDVRGDTSWTFTNYVTVNSTTTAAKITNALITYGTLTNGLITYSTTTHAVSTLATIANAYVAVSTITRAQITYGRGDRFDITNGLITYSTSTVSKMTTAIATTAEVATQLTIPSGNLPTGLPANSLHSLTVSGIATLYISTETTAGAQSWVKVGAQ